MSTRSEARAAIAVALTGTGLFTAVLEGSPKSLGGKSPVAVVRSQAAELVPQARGLATFVWSLYVTIYIAFSSGTPDQVEDLLDARVEASMSTLLGVVPGLSFGSDDTHVNVGASFPPDGAPLHEIDGTIYRAERIPVVWDAEA